MSNIIEQSFKINLTILGFFGLYTSENDSLEKKIYGYTLYILLLVLPTFLGIMDLLLERTSDSIQLNFMVMYFFTITAFSFKILPFLLNAKRLRDCINYFGHPRFMPKTQEEKDVIDECIQVCERNSKIYFYGITIGCLLWILQTVVSSANFPINMWLPYNPLSNYFKYYATFLLYVTVIAYDACAGALMDPLLGGLAYHATCQLKILKYNLTNLDKRVPVRDTEKYGCFVSFELVQETLRQYISFHNEILDFVAEYEECFSWSAFCQFSGSIFTICFSLIGILIDSSPMSIIKDGVCCLCPMVQMLFYCFYGTLLYEENNELTNAIYMGSWYTYDVRIRKILITVMERSKKPMIITFGKVVNLTLATWVSVIKTSYSLIAILNNY